MAITTTRSMLNSISSASSGGTVPSDLVIRDVPDFIPFVRRSDTPMLSLVPRKGERDMLKWEFGEGDLSPRSTTLAESGFDNSETDVTVASGTGTYFQKWDLIKIDDEIMLVTDISTDTLTVTRGWGSTTGAAHDNGSTIYILGPAVPEGVDAPASPTTRGEIFHTYPQIFEYTWQITHRGKVTPNYEIKSDQFKAELKRKMKEAAEDLDDLLLNGVKNAGDGGGTNPSTMGGLREFTTAHVSDLNAAPLELQDILEKLEEVYKEVGLADMGKTLMASMFTKRIWNSWFQPSRRSTQSDAKLRLTWDAVETDFGTIKFVPHYKMANNELFIWNPADSGLFNYKGGNWSTGLYSTQGWYDKGFLRGDFGAIFEGDRRRIRIHDYSTTATDYPNLDIAA